jgi:hypothetical protein
MEDHVDGAAAKPSDQCEYLGRYRQTTNIWAVRSPLARHPNIKEVSRSFKNKGYLSRVTYRNRAISKANLQARAVKEAKLEDAELHTAASGGEGPQVAAIRVVGTHMQPFDVSRTGLTREKICKTSKVLTSDEWLSPHTAVLTKHPISEASG